ncbi:hypothetical protein EF847_04460 [Actinobacteria bacterium YIM 96077]|uniref:SAF domain-containing protein n=1 Tax=Phytoactinopolyspora halophila TaxID=1981511 RepID=A0A329R592_9ACTN|nr:SAF domain-containing protein [Phytoactinopolyspora halophila]AYY12074.1 hypothetical protein EF847_04460 [Actinobacteria bacterium YIM 96077]RAW18692.1 hypothetical protein DPM12_01050 [Phytoactinopolyspora halophila]
MLLSSLPGTGPEVSGEPESPRGVRARRVRWRHPQLIIGALLVLVSVVAGVRVVAAANDTVPVLAAARDLGPGEPLTPDLVQAVDVAFDAGIDRYYTGELGDGYVTVHDLEAGELLSRSAVMPVDEMESTPEALRYLTLAVPGGQVPAGLTAGDSVDVWAISVEDETAEKLVSAVTVVEADTGAGLGMGSQHATVDVAVRASDGDELDELVSRLVAASRSGNVSLSQLP